VDHTIPANQGAYSTAALAVGNAATLQEQYVVEHNILTKIYNDYLGIKEAGKDLILYAAGNDALALLKKQYIGFGDSTVLSMINHLCQKTGIKMTTAQKHKYMATGYNKPWDPTTSITAYFTQLNWFQVSLGDRGIATSNTAEKMMGAGAQMWQGKKFMEDQIDVWENKTAAQQTWAELQTYFTKKWLERKQYITTTAKQLHFKEAAILTQETAAAEDKGELQAMLFAMLQEQHNRIIAAMEATNKANIDTMTERMNALMAGAGGRRPTHHDKEITPTVGNSLPTSTRSGTTQPKKPKRHKCMCPHCKMFVLYKPKNCVELEANKNKLWPG
jgi:hypothetical protein